MGSNSERSRPTMWRQFVVFLAVIISVAVADTSARWTPQKFAQQRYQHLRHQMHVENQMGHWYTLLSKEGGHPVEGRHRTRMLMSAIERKAHALEQDRVTYSP